MIALVECVQILTRFAIQIGNRTSLIVDLGLSNSHFEDPSNKQLTLLLSLFNMTIIDAQSYLDEYEGVFGIKTEKKYSDRVMIIKKINKPLISKIKEWKDLKDFRNHLLAHNLRKGKNGQFIFSIRDLDYNAPRSVMDLFLLSNLIQYSTETINSEFAYERELVNNKNLIEVEPQKNPLSKDDVSSITIKLLKLANIEKGKLNRKYQFSVNITSDWDKI